MGAIIAMDFEKNNQPGEAREDAPFLHWLGKNVMLAVLFVIALSASASILLAVLTHHGQEIVVPDFTNMKVSEAEYAASMADLKVEVTDSVYIRRMGRGVVYTQNPKAGSKVKKNRRVILTINSVNPRKVVMPDLVGLSMRQAKAEISARGLVLGRLIYVEDMATNNVLKQLLGNYQVKAGAQVLSGSPIDLVVGLNPNDDVTYIPDVTGMKYLRAVDGLQTSSLNIGRLSFDKSVKNYSDSLDAVVTRQSPSASSEPVRMGSKVNLTLSKERISK
jgi:beta-lactam-binding protein with PASTA domain